MVVRTFLAPEDAAFVAAIRALPRVHDEGAAATSELFSRAERHGLAGVLLDAYVAAGVPLPEAVQRRAAARELAREADHAAHLAMLREIDRALVRANLVAVALKGALLAERLYPRPSARPCTDIDLLVPEGALDRATEALRAVGYAPWDDPAEARFRAESHHVHLVHPRAPTLELHFDAFKGFGTVMRADPLVARSRPVPGAEPGLSVVRCLAPEDEVVYLAAHAAGHRFMRLGWLYDVWLLVQKLDDDAMRAVVTRAAETKLMRPLVLAFDLLEELFGWSPPALLSSAGRVRFAIATAIAREPTSSLARSATRFVFTLALCADQQSARKYAREAMTGWLGRHLQRR